MSFDADVVIVGAGAAGLACAAAIARASRALRVQVLDANAGPTSDRTYSFFRPLRGADPAVERWLTGDEPTYQTLEFFSPTGESLRRTPTRPYVTLDGAVFQERVLARIGSHPYVTLERGVQVTALEDAGSFVRVVTTSGELRARRVVDARGGLPPTEPAPDDVRWLQHFVGWFVETERPFFEPGVARLMDFRVDQSHGPHFLYVLPRSPTEALVEDTYFSPAPRSPADYEAVLRSFLAEAGPFRIVREERGTLPMTTAVAPPSTGRVITLGQRGGAAKPSTGYAFTFSLRQVEREIDAWRRVGLATSIDLPAPAQPARSPLLASYDAIFLTHLARHPERGGESLYRLFERAPIDSVIRFLSEEPTARDLFHVMNAVPRLAVSAEALRSPRTWLRQWR